MAEDDDDMRAVLVETLERDGHAVVAARDAAGALSLVLAGADDAWTRPSIVLSDVRMPGVDGLTLAEALHARVPHVPVILLTAFPSPEVLDRAYRVGVVAVLAKPFDLDVLRTAVLVFAADAA